MTPILLIRCASCLAFCPLLTLAHEGHVHAEAPGSKSEDIGGIIRITEQGRKNLGIEVAEAQIVDLEETLEAIVEIVPLPERMAVVASKIPGAVRRIHATAGESVDVGAPLVEVESFQAGDPPPGVTYTAPISGIITHWDAAVGESVEPNGHLAEIVDLSQVFVEITLFEGQLDRVKTGQIVRVYIESFPDEVFEGAIALLSGKLDPETRTLKAYARLDNPGARLRPHMRGFGQIVIQRLETVIGIPHQAVTGDPGNLSVFVQRDDEGLEYEQRQVVLGGEDDRFVEVIEGVLPSERVVVSGNYQLRFVEDRTAIAAGGGHGHDHGPGGGDVAEDSSLTHEETPRDHSEMDEAHMHSPPAAERTGNVEGYWRSAFASPLAISLAAGLILSLALNVLLISTRKPAAPAA